MSMGVDSLRPITRPSPELNDPPTTPTFSVNKLVDNVFLPVELSQKCSVSYKLYNIFESVLPGSGHFALIVATTLASMWTDERRQMNVTLAAKPTEGKSSVLKAFAAHPYANFFTTTTFADYLVKWCGRFIDTTMPLGKDVPRGVKREKLAGKWVISVDGCEDRMSNFFDIVHAGEGITAFGQYQKLIQLWSQLVEDGCYEGGTRFSGSFKIASLIHPLKHGIVIACTFKDLENEWIKEQGFLSRTVVCRYWSTEEENEYIRRAKAPPVVRLPDPDKINLSYIVSSLLTHLNPTASMRNMTFSGEITEKYTKSITYLIMRGREEPTVKRATDDTLRILKGHARLNNRDKVVYEDVLFVESLLQMCRHKCVDKITHLCGDRLHFQFHIRKLLGTQPLDVEKQINNTFVWFDSKKPLYTDNSMTQVRKCEMDEDVRSRGNIIRFT